MTTGVLLYGPPASGKDAVTTELTALSPQCELFRRLKCGTARMDGYRPIGRGRLDELTAAGDIVWCNTRYGASYAIDRSGLAEHLNHGTPIVHVGQPGAINAVIAATPDTAWLVIALWCARTTAETRASQRGNTDVAERLSAWDSTPTLSPPATTLNTDLIQPPDAARLIAAAVGRLCHADTA